MSKGSNLGEFEILVLVTILRLGQNAYGISIRDELDQRAGRQVSIGALYATLERLQRKGLIRSRHGEPTAERGGRAKKYFHLEAEGERRLRHSLQALASMTDGVIAWP